jgi:hypothetical protein
MKKLSHISIVLIAAALSLAGCSTDTPTQAPDTSDEVIPQIVAAAAGYESNGLATTVSDITAPLEGDVADMADPATGFATTILADSNAGSGTPGFSLFRQRNQREGGSEWRLHYRLRNGGDRPGQTASAATLSAAMTSSGTFRSDRQVMQGNAVADLQVAGSSAGENSTVSGDYSYRGVAIIQGGDERYEDISVGFNIARLQVAPGHGGQFRPVIGQVDVNITASGPRGIVARSGRLLFDGTQHATLTIGGKKYIVDVRSGQSVGRS